MNYLIYGNSFNLIEIEINKIIKDGNILTLYYPDFDTLEFLDSINYNSMFDDKKNIIIKNFNLVFKTKKDQEFVKSLIRYLKNPNDNTNLIFISNEKINAREKLNKEFLSFVKIIDTPIITKSYELSNILKDLLKKEGYAISQNTLNNFSEKCNCNYDIALNEYNKLKIIKCENHLITDKDIEYNVPNYNITDSFSLKDAIINKDYNKAFKMIDDMENAKMEIIPIIVMLEKEYELIYDIKIISKTVKDNEIIGKKLGNIHPYRIKLLKEFSFMYSEKKLIEIIKLLCNTYLKLVTKDNLGYGELKKILLEI